MRKNRVKLFGSFIMAVIAVMMVGTLGVDGLMSFLFGGSGMLLMAGAILGPGTAVEGTLTQEDLKAVDDLTEEDLNKLMVKVKPSDTPLDTLTRELQNTQEAKSREVGGYEIGTRDVVDTVLLPYEGGDDMAEIKISKRDMWQLHETIFVPGVVGGDGKPLQLYIVGKDNATSKLKVIPCNGVDGAIPAIVDGSQFMRLGNAKGELDAQTDPYTALPSTRKNYTQIHMTQVEVSLLSELQKKKVDLDFATHKELAIWDMKRKMELTNLFGVKSKITNPEKNNEVVYTSDGLWNQLTHTYELDWSGTPSNAMFVNMTRNIFDGNNGSDRRILLAGPELIEWLSYVENYSKQVEARNTEVKQGIRFNRIETSFGELLVKNMSGLFIGNMSKCGMVLDMSYIIKYIHEPLNTIPLDLDKTGQRRAQAHRILENYALFAENLEVHRKIRPVEGSVTTTHLITTTIGETTEAATTEEETTQAATTEEETTQES